MEQKRYVDACMRKSHQGERCFPDNKSDLEISAETFIDDCESER